MALFFAGPGATISLATSLMTFTALFVLARLHVFRQRNGGFLALAIVCLLGAAVPLIESGFSALKSGTGSWSKSTTAGGSSTNGEGQPPLLTESFALTPPEGAGKRVKVLKDSRVFIDQRPFLIKAGDVFSFVDVKGGEATFAVRDLQVSLPASVVDIIDPTAVAQGVTSRRSAPAPAPSALPSETASAPASAPSSSAPTPEELKAITLSAQKEAIRRFPALGIKDSLENAVFVETYQRLRESGNTEFFANPEWPIALADQLAKRDGWVPGGSPMTTSPAPVLDAPADAPAPAAPNGPGGERGGALPAGGYAGCGGGTRLRIAGQRIVREPEGFRSPNIEIRNPVAMREFENPRGAATRLGFAAKFDSNLHCRIRSAHRRRRCGFAEGDRWITGRRGGTPGVRSLH